VQGVATGNWEADALAGGLGLAVACDAVCVHDRARNCVSKAADATRIHAIGRVAAFMIVKRKSRVGRYGGLGSNGLYARSIVPPTG
jgi:hypothetical protein